MIRHLFAYPWLLTLLAALPALGLLALWARRRRRRALVALGNGALLLVRRRQPRVRGWFWLLGLVLLCTASAGPQWGQEMDQAVSGRDLIVVLDCSRSMLAENPNRLRRAHAALLDLCNDVQRHGGHRVGLVVFAGKARVACPLTHDLDHLREVLGSPDNSDALAFDPEIAPGLGDRSGTRIGAGIHAALQARDARFPGGCEILLLSDGDDPASEDEEWATGALEAREAGVPVYTVGIGNRDPDESESKLIMNREIQKHADGQIVRTRLVEEPLRKIASMTNGTYTAMETRPLALGRLYLDLVVDKPAREDADDTLPVYQSRYLWFLAPALALLCLAFAIPGRSA